MYIIATFNVPTKQEKLKRCRKPVGQEMVLCKLQWLGEGKLVMQPGLNDLESKGYGLRLDSKVDKKFRTKFFSLFLSCSSDCITEEEQKQLREWELQRKKQEVARLRDLSKNTTFSHFKTRANEHAAEVSIFGEILKGTHFNSETISVRYLLSLPDGWELNESASEGQTQYASHCQNQFHLSFPVQFNFLVDLQVYQLGICPSLYFDISSLDSWDVYRIEGYGLCSLQIQPGNHSYSVSTWRPKGSFLQELRRYFVGTGQSLSDLKYLRNNPNHFEDRSGWKAESGGFIHLRLHTVTVDPSHLPRTLIKKQFRTSNKNDTSPKNRPRFPKNELSPDFVKPSKRFSPGYFRSQPDRPFPRNQLSPALKTLQKKSVDSNTLVRKEPVIEPLHSAKKKIELAPLRPLTKPLLKGSKAKSNRLQALLKRSEKKKTSEQF